MKLVIHGHAETDVLPQGTHVALTDAVVDECAYLFRIGARDAVLGDVHVPFLDVIVNLLGQIELDSLMLGPEIRTVDAPVVDGQQVGLNAVFHQRSDKPARFLGPREPLGSALLGADFAQAPLPGRVQRR